MKVKISVPPYVRIGYIIGSGGGTIKRIGRETQTTIITPWTEDDRTLTIYGTPENVDDAVKWILYLANTQAAQAQQPPLTRSQFVTQEQRAHDDPPPQQYHGDPPPQQQQFIQGGPPSQQQFMPSGPAPQQQFMPSGPPLQQRFIQNGPPRQELFAHSGPSPQQAHGGMVPPHHDHWTSVPSQVQKASSSGLSTPLRVDLSGSSASRLSSTSEPKEQHLGPRSDTPTTDRQTSHHAQSADRNAPLQLARASRNEYVKMCRNDFTGLYYQFIRPAFESKYRCIKCEVAYDAERRINQRGEEVISIIDADKNHLNGPNCELSDGEQRNASKRLSSTGTTSEMVSTAAKTPRMNVDFNEGPRQKFTNVSVGNRYSRNDDDVRVLDSGIVSKGLDSGGHQPILHRANDERRQSQSSEGAQSKIPRTDVCFNEKYANVSVGNRYESNGGGVRVLQSGAVSQGLDSGGHQPILHRANDERRQSFSHHSQFGEGAQSSSGEHSTPEPNRQRSPSPAGDFLLKQHVDVPGEHGKPWTVTNVVRESKQVRYINMILPCGRRFYGFQHPLRNPADTRCRKCNRGTGPGCNAVERLIGGKRVWMVENPSKSHSQCSMDVDTRYADRVFGSTSVASFDARTQLAPKSDERPVISAGGSAVVANAEHGERAGNEKQMNPHVSGRRTSVPALNVLLAQQRAIEAGGVVSTIPPDQMRMKRKSIKATMRKFKIP